VAAAWSRALTRDGKELFDSSGALTRILRTCREQVRTAAHASGRAVGEAESRAVEAAFLKAYRWQYIHSGAQQPHFGKVLSRLIINAQGQRIQAALATLR
jgi:hypothetical protein